MFNKTYSTLKEGSRKTPSVMFWCRQWNMHEQQVNVSCHICHYFCSCSMHITWKLLMNVKIEVQILHPTSNQTHKKLRLPAQIDDAITTHDWSWNLKWCWNRKNKRENAISVERHNFLRQNRFSCAFCGFRHNFAKSRFLKSLYCAKRARCCGKRLPWYLMLPAFLHADCMIMQASIACADEDEENFRLKVIIKLSSWTCINTDVWKQWIDPDQCTKHIHIGKWSAYTAHQTLRHCQSWALWWCWHYKHQGAILQTPPSLASTVSNHSSHWIRNHCAHAHGGGFEWRYPSIWCVLLQDAIHFQLKPRTGFKT